MKRPSVNLGRWVSQWVSLSGQSNQNTARPSGSRQEYSQPRAANTVHSAGLSLLPICRDRTGQDTVSPSGLQICSEAGLPGRVVANVGGEVHPRGGLEALFGGRQTQLKNVQPERLWDWSWESTRGKAWGRSAGHQVKDAPGPGGDRPHLPGYFISGTSHQGEEEKLWAFHSP